jgi:hypothetical protein
MGMIGAVLVMLAAFLGDVVVALPPKVGAGVRAHALMPVRSVVATVQP